MVFYFFFSSRRRHTRFDCDWSSDVCSSDLLGQALAEHLKRGSLALYEAGRSYARANGIIIADTKFEFGTTATGELLVIDEILTPDSSRFWPADRYRPGKSQPSFDKQPLRDYLADLKRQGRWNGNPPPPPLPPEVVRATSERYLDAYRRLTGKALEGRAGRAHV